MLRQKVCYIKINFCKFGGQQETREHHDCRVTLEQIMLQVEAAHELDRLREHHVLQIGGESGLDQFDQLANLKAHYDLLVLGGETLQVSKIKMQFTLVM